MKGNETIAPIKEWPKIVPLFGSFVYIKNDHFFMLGLKIISYTDAQNVKVRKSKDRLVFLPKLQSKLT